MVKQLPWMDQLILKHRERYIGEQRKTREMFQKQMRQLQERRELMNIERDLLDVNLQVQDQSNKKPLKEASNWLSKLSTSSNIRLLLSLQVQHIKLNGTKTQMFEECLPNQSHQPKIKEQVSSLSNAFWLLFFRISNELLQI